MTFCYSMVNSDTMMRFYSVFYIIFITICYHVFSVSCASTSISRGKGTVDNKPVFLTGNYIPAAMHVMFYLSDQMKYELKPGSNEQTGVSSGVTTSTTVRPTPPHKPGYFAPEKPPRPAGITPNSGWSGWSFGWGRIENSESINTEEHAQQEPLPEDIDLFGAGPSEILRQINTLEDVDTIGDDDDIGQIAKFSVNYEDHVNLDYLRQKRVPPTRAFVTVLSLYDLLNKEAKELGLNKFNGYADGILQELINTSSGSSSNQLKFVLSKIVQKRNTKKDNILKKIKTLISDLEKPDSYINNAIKYIPALQFSLAKCA